MSHGKYGALVNLLNKLKVIDVTGYSVKVILKPINVLGGLAATEVDHGEAVNVSFILGPKRGRR